MRLGIFLLRNVRVIVLTELEFGYIEWPVSSLALPLSTAHPRMQAKSVFKLIFRWVFLLFVSGWWSLGWAMGGALNYRLSESEKFWHLQLNKQGFTRELRCSDWSTQVYHNPENRLRTATQYRWAYSSPSRPGSPAWTVSHNLSWWEVMRLSRDLVVWLTMVIYSILEWYI